MSKYMERLAQSKEARSESENKLSEQRAKNSVAAKILDLENQSATVDAATDAAYRSTPFNVEKVLQLAEEKESIGKSLATLKSIQSSEFGS